MKYAALTPLFAVLLVACGSAPDATPGSVTPDEAQALNDAAAMLDANSVDSNVLGEGAGEPDQRR